MTLPNFLVFGAGRSGTTSLHHYLAQHPQIFIPQVKEANFFAFTGEKITVEDHYDKWLLQNSVTDRDRYEALFDNVSGECAIGEVSPWYLFHSQAATRIKALIPEVRLISILRNPADRAYAAFVARRANGWEIQPDLHSAIDEEERRLRHNIRPGIYNYRARGNYAFQLKRYFDLFARDQIRIYLFEEFRQDPGATLLDIFDFLGVDIQFRPNIAERHNPSGQIRNPVLRELWRSSATMREWIRPHISMELRHNVSQWLHRNAYKPPFPPRLRAELIEYYRPDIQQLEGLLDRDLSLWLD